ncbi:MAG: tetratricopeptide repeat protein [Muribaculaceae bacterium]|nr:tetratricopeptide repeat protein [Muribaculaceae bacterium]
MKIKDIFKLVFATILFMVSMDAMAQDESNPLEGHTSLYYSSRAARLEEANSWEAAKREIDEGLKHYPDDPELLYLNGRYLYFTQHDLQKARYNLVKALQENDQLYDAKRLLIDVEEESRHYSSAICYINELLEVQPYDRGLWRRKIALYNKTGNRVEAEAALNRLSRIYPNDSVIKQQLNLLTRENWAKRLNNTSLGEKATNLESWINTDPQNLDYYIELSDTYIKMGDYDKALNTAKRGLVEFPGNNFLVRRVASLMSEEGLYTRALMFLKENRENGAYYDNIMREAANDARLRDAYEIHGRLYEKTGDRDALTYLLNTSLTRGYYDDALGYLHEAYKLEGRTAELLIKEYALQKRMGNRGQADKILQELFARKPADEEIKEEYIAMQLELATIDEDQQDWQQAYERLTNACNAMEKGSDQWVAAMSRRILLLGKMGDDLEARKLYGEASIENPDHQHRFAAAYEDIMAKEIKQLIEDERYESAFRKAKELRSTVHNSQLALRTCINMAQTLKLKEDFYKYARLGYEYYPDEPYFIIKQALALQQQGLYPEAMKLLNPQKEGAGYATTQLINPYVGVTEDFARLLLDRKMPDLAIENIDLALKYDPDNRELRYLKGVAFEQMKDYGKAYEYLSKNYDPSNAEQEEWTQRMRYLRFRSLKNRFDISFLSAFYDNRESNLASIAHMYSLATFSYTRIWKNTTLSVGFNYKGTDGYEGFGNYEEGGSGIEPWAELTQSLRHGWTMTISGSYGSKFFNKVGGNLQFDAALRQGWSLGAKASYRLTPPLFIYDKNKDWDGDYKKRNVLMIGPRVSKEWEKIGLFLNVDLISLDFIKNYYYNVGLKGKFFFNEDGVSSISALGGFGSFPELTFFDQTTMNGVTNMNAMVGAEATYLFSKNFYASLAGTWNTYYNPVFTDSGQPVDSYRNIYSVSLSLHLAF